MALNGERVDVDDGETAGFPESVVNVARTYAALRDDVIDGTSVTPDFDDAVRLSHLIDDIVASAADGCSRAPTPTAPS